MSQWCVKIVHGLVLLVTGMALVGVNVQQLYCYHSDHIHWEVRILPEEEACPCEEGCCGEDGCHHPVRCDFYKVTDLSQVETGIQMVLFPCDLTRLLLSTLWDLPVAPEQVCLYRHKIPDIFMNRELLCTYLC